MDYTLIINELLSKLKQHYSRIEILNTFIGSPFHLESESLMLKKSSLVNYKLWHSFFDYIYAKQGMSWLTIMEPTVNHLVSSYDLEMPAIYRSETIKLRQEARDLEEKKVALESSLFSLNKQIEDAKDLILRDKLTMLYQQDVLYKMMTEHFSSHVAPAGKTRGLLLIQLDQLPDINRRFNKETGDETVRNMVYVIDQVKHEKTLLFKQRGPGIYALIENETLEYIINEAVAFRNAVAQATSFIEKVTVSIAVVTCHEVDENLPIDERLNNLMNLIEKRMAYAKVKGQNLIIDERTELPEHIEGSLLLVDQDEINRNMLYRIFKRAHYEIVLADSVVEALSILQKHKIDIVISEINLSKMDGFQLKMKMNESKSFQDIPFIMVSHNKTIENIKRGNLLGVDLILEKPIVPEELIGHVNRMKERVRS
jgi:diguanylate cyclase (GGDEF)-like protein